MLNQPCRLLCLAGLFVFLGGLGTGRAQDPSNVSLDELDKESRAHFELIKGLRKGTTAAEPGNKAHMDAIDFHARNLIYRLAHPLYHNVGGMDARNTVARLFRDFDDDVGMIVAGKEKTKDMARLFGLKVIEHGRKVLDVPKPLVHINAARFLARSADLGQPELADALAEVLSDPKSTDAVKYYALQGLRKLLAQPITPPVLTPERAAKVLPAVIAQVTRKMTITEATPPEEIAGFQVLRREAVRALAQSRIPFLSSKEMPALVLAQVLAREDFTPPVRMDERMEAAIGLARMRPDKNKDYQPDYAAQQIALFLDEFGTWYQTKNKEEEHRPVRVLASQLLEAMEQLQAETKDAYVDRAVKGGVKRLLETIEKGGNADPSEVVTFAEANASSGQLFKSVANSKVKAPNRKTE